MYLEGNTTRLCKTIKVFEGERAFWDFLIKR
jgi:hypothetical protein